MLGVVSFLASLSLAYALVSEGQNNPLLIPRPIGQAISAHPSQEKSTFRIPHSGGEHPPLNTVYYFHQYIDHKDHTLGTFLQRYWVSSEFYEPGGPIILFTPGEENGEGYTGYLTNRTINGQIAKQQRGAAVMIEHRFYGLSNPYANLSVESFKYHTIEQAIGDLVHFAKTVTLPFDGGDKVSPTHAPWVLVGGSYSGTLTVYTLHRHPDVFWAGYASSAPVQAMTNFWQYYEPVRQYMPQNCSNDVQRVVKLWDKVISSGNEKAYNELKALFGLSEVIHTVDVVNTLRTPLEQWQLLTPTSGGGKFHDFCENLEVLDEVFVADADGWGLGHALNAWANYSRKYVSTTCGKTNVDKCLNTYNTDTSFYDIAVNNPVRSWWWTTCTELGLFQGTAPLGEPTLVSHLLPASYNVRICKQLFGDVFPNVKATNDAFGGYFVQAERLFVANGRRDPWRYAALSTDNVNVPNLSTPDRPIAESEGFHCSDLITENGLADITVGSVQKQGLWHIKRWLADWSAEEEAIVVQMKRDRVEL